jgi:hypothetical protein
MRGTSRASGARSLRWPIGVKERSIVRELTASSTPSVLPADPRMGTQRIYNAVAGTRAHVTPRCAGGGRGKAQAHTDSSLVTPLRSSTCTRTQRPRQTTRPAASPHRCLEAPVAAHVGDVCDAACLDNVADDACPHVVCVPAVRGFSLRVAHGTARRHPPLKVIVSPVIS